MDTNEAWQQSYGLSAYRRLPALERSRWLPNLRLARQSRTGGAIQRWLGDRSITSTAVDTALPPHPNRRFLARLRTRDPLGMLDDVEFDE
jgi:hypothetical protein